MDTFSEDSPESGDLDASVRKPTNIKLKIVDRYVVSNAWNVDMIVRIGSFEISPLMFKKIHHRTYLFRSLASPAEKVCKDNKSLHAVSGVLLL